MIKKPKWLNPIGVTLGLLGLGGVYFALLVSKPDFLSQNAFYHAAFAKLYSQGTFDLSQFGFLPDSLFSHRFIDQHFLYHLYLTPFITMFSDAIALKAANASLMALLSLSIYALLRNQKVKMAFLWAALIPLFDLHMLERFFFQRPAPMIAAGLFSFMWLLVRSSRPALYFVHSLIFINFSYLAWLALPLAIIHAVVTRPLMKLRTWKLPAVTAAGLTFGLLIHPDPLLIFSYSFGLIQAMGSGSENVLEWLPRSGLTLFTSVYFPVFVAILLLAASPIYGMKLNRDRVFLAGVALLFAVLAFMARRFEPYFYLSAFTFVVVTWSPPSFKEVWLSIRKAPGSLKKIKSLAWTLTAVVFFTSLSARSIHWFVKDYQANLSTVSSIANFSQWLKNSPYSDKKFLLARWTYWSQLFYDLPQTSGQPGFSTFIYERRHPGLARTHDKLKSSEDDVRLESVFELHRRLESPYILTEKGERVYHTLSSYPEFFELLYEDKDAAFYAIHAPVQAETPSPLNPRLAELFHQAFVSQKVTSHDWLIKITQVIPSDLRSHPGSRLQWVLQKGDSYHASDLIPLSEIEQRIENIQNSVQDWQSEQSSDEELQVHLHLFSQPQKINNLAQIKFSKHPEFLALVEKNSREEALIHYSGTHVIQDAHPKANATYLVYQHQMASSNGRSNHPGALGRFFLTPPLSLSALEERTRLALEQFSQFLTPDGSFHYLFDLSRGEFVREGPTSRVRLLLGTYSLCSAISKMKTAPVPMSTCQKAFVHTQNQMSHIDQWETLGEVSALGLSYLSYVRATEVTSESKQDLQRIGREILEFYQESEQRFLTHRRGLNQQQELFSPGEALLFLAQAGTLLQEQEWLEVVEESFPYYLKQFQERQNLFQVRWFLEAYAHAFRESQNSLYLAYLYEVEKLLAPLFDEPQPHPGMQGCLRGPSPRNGTFYWPDNMSPLLLEGLAATLVISKNAGNDIEKLQTWAEPLVLCTLNQQLSSWSRPYFKNFQSVQGGVPSSWEQPILRVDLQGHALMGLASYLQWKQNAAAQASEDLQKKPETH